MPWLLMSHVAPVAVRMSPSVSSPMPPSLSAHHVRPQPVPWPSPSQSPRRALQTERVEAEPFKTDPIKTEPKSPVSLTPQERLLSHWPLMYEHIDQLHRPGKGNWQQVAETINSEYMLATT